ncbi:MAG: Wzz/FepE/Etk N-terminal domain-containing protein, partial [Massilibacteroides sp.]|nr:Wzz/FepE/Etk N-terminal domain-containing protein [Massilibacteroides sp.]
MENNNTIHPPEEEKEITLSDLFFILRANWKWFVLSIAACLLVAYFYVKVTPKEYSRSATVLIKDNSKGGISTGESALFQDFGMFNIKSSVDNEMLVFQSKRLMTNVVMRLGLDKSYKIRKGLRDVELYTQSPIAIRFTNHDYPNDLSVAVTPISENEVLLSDFSEGETSEMTVQL